MDESVSDEEVDDDQAAIRFERVWIVSQDGNHFLDRHELRRKRIRLAFPKVANYRQTDLE